MNPAMVKMLGALTSVGQVIFSDSPGKGTDQSYSLSFELARSNPGNGSYLQATGNKNKAGKNDEVKQGWYKEAKGWVYYRNDKKVKGEFIEDDSKWYYLDSKGYMAIGWSTIKKNKYYFKANGERVHGFREIENIWYYFDNNGRLLRSSLLDYKGNTYYLDKEGKMVTGLYKIEKKQYYFDDEGHMAKGKSEIILGKQYYFDTKGVETPIYNIGDFIFVDTDNEEQLKKDEEQAEALQKSHQDYHGYVPIKFYVTKGSILGCTKGTKLTRLDAAKAADVCDVYTGWPILGCKACNREENIHSFFSCTAMGSKELPMRKLMPDGYEKCIPLYEGEWQQPNEGTPILWNSTTDECSYALKDEAFIVCKYKGIIGVIELPEEKEEELKPTKIAVGYAMFGFSEKSFRGGRDFDIDGTALSDYRYKIIDEVFKPYYNYKSSPDWYMPEKWDEQENGIAVNQYAYNSKMTPYAVTPDDVIKNQYGIYVDKEERYWIAVGPTIMNASYDENGKIETETMKYGCKIDVLIEHMVSHQQVWLYCILGDAKNHTFSGKVNGRRIDGKGVFQTGFDPQGNWESKHMDASIVEFIGEGHGKPLQELSQYKLIKLVVYD